MELNACQFQNPILLWGKKNYTEQCGYPFLRSISSVRVFLAPRNLILFPPHSWQLLLQLQFLVCLLTQGK